MEAAIREGWKTAPWQKMSRKELERAIEKQRRLMLAAAKELDFTTAARLRDELLQMSDKLDTLL